MVEIIKPQPFNAELIPMLRGKDEGRKIIEIRYRMHDQHFVQPVPLNGDRHGTSLQWNGQFVIEPFQAGRRIDLIKGKTPNIHPRM